MDFRARIEKAKVEYVCVLRVFCLNKMKFKKNIHTSLDLDTICFIYGKNITYFLLV